jgi:hypothetical protein
VAALVGNVHGLRHSVINAEIYAPGNLRCLIAYTRGQSWDNFPEPPVREQDERKRRT